jgi:hypothetical protein
MESGAYTALKTAPDTDDRAACKTTIAQQVRDEHGLDITLCGEALDILEAALFGENVQSSYQQAPQLSPTYTLPSSTATLQTENVTPQVTPQKKKTYYGLVVAVVVAIVAAIGIALYQPTATVERARVQAAIYKIGDIGPAGGIIFYDKGNDSGGWRYLEAAPAETEGIPQMFTGHILYGEITDRIYGAGLRNTRIFLEKLQINNINGNTAPQFCDNLVYNGYDDWYLPSLNELLKMYGILRDNRNAGFQPLKYWTSTCYPRGAAYSVDFSTGQATSFYFDETVHVRACRRF